MIITVIIVIYYYFSLLLLLLLLLFLLAFGHTGGLTYSKYDMHKTYENLPSSYPTQLSTSTESMD